MIHRTYRWFAVVLPPTWAVAVFVALLLVAEFVCWWVDWAVGFDESTAMALRIRDQVIIFGLVALGVYRAVAFHPVFRKSYSQWLEATPWTAAKPLPLGPVHLVPQDGAVLGLVILAAHSPQVEVLSFLFSFLVPYLGLLCLAFVLTGPWWMAYLPAFGLGLVTRLIEFPTAALCTIGAIYLAVCFGLPKAMARFPWELPKPWETFKEQVFTVSKTRTNQKSLGWPYDHLQPNPPARGLSYRDGILLSLLAGWWTYTVASNITYEDDQHTMLAMANMVAVVAGVAGRLGTYCNSHWPPISLWGRLLTFRWIIPGYDRVFVAPILTLLVGTACMVTIDHFSLPREIAQPISVTLTLLVALCAGPTLSNWQLTGAHRITPALSKGPEFIKL